MCMCMYLVYDSGAPAGVSCVCDSLARRRAHRHQTIRPSFLFSIIVVRGDGWQARARARELHPRGGWWSWSGLCCGGRHGCRSRAHGRSGELELGRGSAAEGRRGRRQLSAVAAAPAAPLGRGLARAEAQDARTGACGAALCKRTREVAEALRTPEAARSSAPFSCRAVGLAAEAGAARGQSRRWGDVRHPSHARCPAAAQPGRSAC